MTGIRIHFNARIQAEDKENLERVAQYIPRSPFPVDKMQLNPVGSIMYSNKCRGQRAGDQAEQALTQQADQSNDHAEQIIPIKEEKRRRIPSKTWRELIKKVWEMDPLHCPHCDHAMRIIALINEADVIEKILKHLGSWRNAEQARAPPTIEVKIYEPFYDDLPFQPELSM